jgi:hypothetical protein
MGGSGRPDAAQARVSDAPEAMAEVHAPHYAEFMPRAPLMGRGEWVWVAVLAAIALSAVLLAAFS